MKITFLGAAQNVTGSRFLLEVEKYRILVDCGIFQERDLRARNWEKFPVDPSTVELVLLTHAHIDHCGYLPKFVKEGFQGRIICTPPSADIAKISLLDSAKIQESDAEYKRKRHKREGRSGPYPAVPLYTLEDAREVASRFQTVEYNKQIRVAPNIKATYFDAGHILGSAMIVLEVKENNKVQKLLFSGDIGRWNRPILKDPSLIQNADYVIMEATYGNRLHEDGMTCQQKLEEVIRETYQKGGNIVIPSFAIGRTQELLFDLNQLFNEKKIPHILTFVDSPMARDITRVFEKHTGYFDQDAQKIMRSDSELFDFPMLKFTPSVRESKGINSLRGTAIIIASSGMCTGGRIKHHLYTNITRPESTILFVGYQAIGTLGREILEKPKKVRIFRNSLKVRAKIEKINGLSAHADKVELLKWVAGFKQDPRKIFIVHAEKEAAEAFAYELNQKSNSEVIIPAYLSEYDLS